MSHITFVFGNVISVTTFKNNTSNPQNIWIGEAIADNLTSDLSKFNSLQIINRSHLKDILKEQKLNYSGIINEEDQTKIGELIGADKILRGSYTILNNVLIINIIAGNSHG